MEKVSSALKSQRSEEARTKRVAFSSARDLAKAVDAAATARVNTKSGSEKDLAKVSERTAARSLEQMDPVMTGEFI